jgi:hypothetical protein
MTYTLSNPLIDIGGTLCGSDVQFSVTSNANFVSVSPASGMLAPNGVATVTVSLLASANSLPAGTYVDSLKFIDTVTHFGDTERELALIITGSDPCLGSLQIVPETGLRSTGPPGGPFVPQSTTYTLMNPTIDVGGTPCGSTIDFTVASTAGFYGVSPAGGTLAPGGTAIVTASLLPGAENLPAGSYGNSLIFTDTVNHRGDTARTLLLVIEGLDDRTGALGAIAHILSLLLESEDDESEDEESP